MSPRPVVPHRTGSTRTFLPMPTAEARARARLTEPITPFPGTTVAWRRRCLGCGRGVDKHLDFSCSYCSTAIGTGHHARLPADVAFARAYRTGQQPLTSWQGVGRVMALWRMRCLLCGEAGAKSLGHLHQGVGICAGCATFGFDSTAPAEVYVVTLADQVGKFGIGGLDTDSSRVAQHRRAGWQIFARWDFDVGAQARHIEGQVAEHVRTTWGIPIALTDERDMPQNGWTETFDLHACSAEAVRQLIESRIAELDASVGVTATGVKDRRRARQNRSFAEARAAGAEPAHPYPGSVDEPWEMRCFACGTQLPRRLGHLREGQGCATCAGHARRTPHHRAVALARTGLVEPVFAVAPESAHTPFPGRCFGCGRRHDSLRVANFLGGQGGCADCGSTRTGKANRLNPISASHRFLARGLVLREVYSTNEDRVRCRCVICGWTGALTPASVFAGTSSCRSCEKSRLIAQYRTPHGEAVTVMLRGGWYPLVPYTNAKTRWPSRCLFCGTREHPTKTNTQHRGSGADCTGRKRHKRPRS